MTSNKAVKGIRKYCTLTEHQLVGKDEYRFIDNGSNVLAVAHADTVAKDKHNFSVSGDNVTSIALDDRLGIWIIMELLPVFGVVPDILITRDEEIGQSTAQLFRPYKQYNWMFSFDRHGYDVVMYQYDNEESRGILEEHGFPIGVGSFSDISFLDAAGCIGFNFGTGYFNEHTPSCSANVRQVITQVQLFSLFYHQYCDVPMPYAYEENYYFGLWQPDFSFKCVYCGDTLDDYNISEDNPDVCILCEDALLDAECQLYKENDFSDDYNYNDRLSDYFIDRLLDRKKREGK